MSRADVTALAGRYGGYAGSGEHAAVAVLLSCADITSAAKFHRHAGPRGIDWDGVLGERWPPAERLLIATAAGLWSGRRTTVDISRAGFLDDGQYAVWAAMLAAHRTGRVPDTDPASGPASDGGEPPVAGGGRGPQSPARSGAAASTSPLPGAPGGDGGGR